MTAWWEHNSDKIIILAILLAFGYSAAHGAAYSQHVVDWVLGALGVLIVQRVKAVATAQTNLNCTVTGSGSSQVTTCPGAFAVGTTVLGPYTIGSGAHQLPASASGNSGWITIITDGSSTSDCTTGSGSTPVLCRSNGSTWSSLGGGASIPQGATLPATCSVGNLYFLTVSPVGLYACVSTNGWALSSSGVGTGSGTLTLYGSTSGSRSISVPPVAGSPSTVLLPANEPAEGQLAMMHAPSSGNSQMYWGSAAGESGWVSAATPVFAPTAGTYAGTQTVAVTCATGTPYCSTNGLVSAGSSCSALSVSASATIYASCRGVEWTPSSASAAYTITAGNILYYGYGCNGTSTMTCTVGTGTQGNLPIYMTFSSSFTTGSNAAGYTVSQVGSYWDLYYADPAAATWGAAIYTVTSDNATLVTGCTMLGAALPSTVNNWATASMSCTLAHDTTYYLVINDGPDSTNSAYQTARTSGGTGYEAANTYTSFPSTMSGLSNNNYQVSAYVKVVSN